MRKYNEQKMRTMIDYLCSVEAQDTAMANIMRKALYREYNVSKEITKDELMQHRGLASQNKTYKQAYRHITTLLKRERDIIRNYL